VVIVGWAARRIVGAKAVCIGGASIGQGMAPQAYIRMSRAERLLQTDWLRACGTNCPMTTLVDIAVRIFFQQAADLLFTYQAGSACTQMIRVVHMAE
jgi:hypothetical protein